MLTWFSNLIPLFFYLLFFFVPLVLFPQSSELFEFNKIILVYILTVLIVSAWAIKMVLGKKIIFRRTIIDVPLLLFMVTQVLSTITSIDSRASIFGYYSRFHGGLTSSLSYALLYWAFVSHMDRKRTLKSVYILLASATLVSIYGILEHFGLDRNIWVQDVQNRVFSTLGQPNWLAAWLVALLPITWALSLNSKIKIIRLNIQLKNQSFWLWLLLSSLFFITLLYTKSRSGLLGFLGADLFFWFGIGLSTLQHKVSIKKYLKQFLILHFAFLMLALASGTPWTPSLKEVTKTNDAIQENQALEEKPQGPALAVGGSRSTEIRKIVWRGAADIWKNYPILGSGVETFAYSYYSFRPVEHNLVTEWDYLYNKAHNEYLNIAANTGTIGLVGYFILIIAIGHKMFKAVIIKPSRRNLEQNLKPESKNKTTFAVWNLSFLAGFISILITNFFGFSVVPVALQFFLYPAMAIAIARESEKVREREIKKLTPMQKGSLILVISFTLLLFYSILRYWYADYLYAKGKIENDSENFVSARMCLIRATNLSPKEAYFLEELSEASTGIALSYYDQGDESNAQKLAILAISESDRAIKLSPANVNLKRSRARMFIKLSSINPSFLINARNTLIAAVEQAPTDAKLSYNLGISFIRTGEIDNAIETLKKTIEMKDNYRNARFALALLYIDKGEIEKAKEQLEYILAYISPNDPQVKQELAELTN